MRFPKFDPPSLIRRPGLLIGLLVFALLAAVYGALLFQQPWHEHSDYAVNALQIGRAAELREIHGNYSRFGFYHPGPAFFYVYALSERILHDGLGWLPSPHNAHALAGLALQCFFFAAALTVASAWIRRPLFIPLALLAAAVHFGFAEYAFIDIWPPRVLLMPFLCFLVSAGSVSAGRIRHLPLMVLAGCFLVHGHVAQPLFVVPVFLCAYAMFWWHARHSRRDLAAAGGSVRTAHILSLACIALFLVPLVADLLAGAQSNFAQILGILQVHSNQRKSVWKALLYFCAFFSYLRTPEEFLPEHGPGRADFMAERYGYYLVWGAVLAVAIACVVRSFGQRSTEERTFVLRFAGILLLTFGLSLCWGVLQMGAMFSYNGYFYFATLYGILLLLCAGLSTLAVPKPRIVAAVVCIAAALFAWNWRRTPSHIDYTSNSIVTGVQAAALADPSRGTVKHLLFDPPEWSDAVSVALALKRAGVDFSANLEWGPKFDPGAGFEPSAPGFDYAGHSIWRLSRRGPPDEGHPIVGHLRVYFEPLPLDPVNTVIHCGEGRNLELYALFGFGTPNGPGVWTARPYAGLGFLSSPTAADVLVTITAEPFALRNTPAAQSMALRVNGHEVMACTFTSRRAVTARIPAAIWNSTPQVTMVLHLPDALYPHRTKLPKDPRLVGLRIETIAFQLAP